MKTQSGSQRPRLLADPSEALMQRLEDSKEVVPLSFELFPPRGAQHRDALYETVKRLASAASEGFTVTMGAGGATRSGTHDTAIEVAEITGRPVTAHLIATGLSRDGALAAADGFWEAGITRILALRGDPPRTARGPLPPGFRHAADLVTALRKRHPFEIAVAAYPEKHPEANTFDEDVDRLKEKLDAGASKAVCQFVLDPAAYARFLDTCGRHGIDAPIVPGLMPIESWTRVRGFARANEVSVPNWLDHLFSQAEQVPELLPYISAAATIEQAHRLIGYGAPALHVYTMNRWPLSLALAKLLGH